MFMASNQFKIVKGQEEAFENMWAARNARFHQAPGFISSRFQKGRENGNHVLYFSLTVWATEECFLAWRSSERFREDPEDMSQRRHGASPLDDLAGLPRRNPQ